METTKTIAKWTRAGGVEMRVSRTSYRGRDNVDLRYWMEGDKPTRKGVTVAVADVPDLITALTNAVETT